MSTHLSLRRFYKNLYHRVVFHKQTRQSNAVLHFLSAKKQPYLTASQLILLRVHFPYLFHLRGVQYLDFVINSLPRFPDLHTNNFLGILHNPPLVFFFVMKLYRIIDNVDRDAVQMSLRVLNER